MPLEPKSPNRNRVMWGPIFQWTWGSTQSCLVLVSHFLGHPLHLFYCQIWSKAIPGKIQFQIKCLWWSGQTLFPVWSSSLMWENMVLWLNKAIKYGTRGGVGSRLASLMFTRANWFSIADSWPCKVASFGLSSEPEVPQKLSACF